MDAGASAVREILSSPETPTVIFCGSDLIALGAITALEEAGGRIPEDVSIRYLLRLPRPPHLTTIQRAGCGSCFCYRIWDPPILWPATILPWAGSRTGGWRLWSLAKPSGPRAGFLARSEKSLHFNRRSARRTNAPSTTSPRDSNGAAPHAIDYTLRSQPIKLGCCLSVGC